MTDNKTIVKCPVDNISYRKIVRCPGVDCENCPALEAKKKINKLPQKIISKKVSKKDFKESKESLKVYPPFYRKTTYTSEELIEQNLEFCRWAFEGGNFGALKDVLYYCQRFQKQLPEWANLTLFELLNNFMSGNIKKIKGRHSKWIKQYKQDMIDSLRAETVQYWIERGIKWADAYHASSKDLEDTFAKGSEDTIAKSYKRYKQRIKKEPFRYAILYTVRSSFLGHPLTEKRIETLKYIESLKI